MITTNKVIFTKESDVRYSIYFNHKYLGKLVMESGGDFLFWGATNLGGGWNWYTLREISDKIKEINVKYEENTG